ncbi:6-carboxytetrahydropterin synthase QueD [Pelobium manganitolerans]|uniref:6-carboxy-5,6,7,8-tetrahydropterin synthase n=1 Tax=Pelobium manganitolerans TaxID=1842495 RepID=A0A419S5R4_9SPHI|nr:6-carboxytetrahydropterin synthase QueD [Pelobium manganitolerans]RKD16198.1 6-carboxytetrahydropterin synthase QueD [Pelobium manganitolerans]
MLIYKQFTFDAAHFLPNVSETHKCRKIHGHTYHLTLFFEGEVSAEYGWVIDFADIKKHVNPIVKSLDHHFLNEIEGLENPTSEVICMWLWNKIKPLIPELCRIELKETPTSGAVYSGK